MKRKLLLVGMLGFTALFGCSQSSKVEAGLPEGFVKVSEVDVYGTDVTEIKHIKTGCHYIITDGYYEGGITQMFIEKNGVSVPYCEEVK